MPKNKTHSGIKKRVRITGKNGTTGEYFLDPIETGPRAAVLPPVAGSANSGETDLAAVGVVTGPAAVAGVFRVRVTGRPQAAASSRKRCTCASLCAATFEQNLARPCVSETGIGPRGFWLFCGFLWISCLSDLD